MNTKDEKGITLVALVIMVILLTIIGAFSINILKNSEVNTLFKDRSLQSELNMVQHSILERYVKYLVVKDSNLLVGKKIDNINNLPYEITFISALNKEYNLEQEYNNELPIDKYYYIISNKAVDNINYFELLDIENSNNIYMVNYYTG